MNQQADKNLLNIELVFATADQQALMELQLPRGSTVADAVSLSGLPQKFPQLIGPDSPLGVWGRVVKADCVLRDGDRVEIYRYLLIDPREQRRLLALQGKSMNQGDSE